MVSEEIRSLVQELINQKFVGVLERLNNLEREYQKFIQQNCFRMNEIQQKYETIYEQIDEAKKQAKTVLEQTEKRIKEIEKVKSNQAASLEKLIKSGCEWLKNTSIPVNRQQAQNDGLTACLVCKP